MEREGQGGVMLDMGGMLVRVLYTKSKGRRRSFDTRRRNVACFCPILYSYSPHDFFRHEALRLDDLI